MEKTEVNALRKLRSRGQSVWLDFISRGLLLSGGLRRLIEEDGISGVTSNPTIFEKAITEGREYDDELRELWKKKLEVKEIFRQVAVDDVRAAADLLRPTWEESGGVDGYVSIEVAPELAYDSKGSIERARLLFGMVDRPNVLVKIPGTLPGLEAIEELTAEGRNVNVTLLFSLHRYREVIEAYLRGLDRLKAAGGDLSKVFSVASFFVSRVDTSIDKLIETRLDEIEEGAETDLQSRLAALKGKVAVANARLAYRIYREVYSGSRFAELSKAGARPQRLLWASTSTKNPEYSDVLYVEELIGPETINTMTSATIDAFLDHGTVAETLTQDFEGAERLLEELAAVGIDLSQVTAELEREGVEAFSASYDSLMDHIRAKAENILGKESAA